MTENKSFFEKTYKGFFAPTPKRTPQRDLYLDREELAVLRQIPHAPVDELIRETHPNLPNREGKTPLMCAATSCDLQSTQLLLQAKADVNAQDNEGNTPLMCMPSEYRYKDEAVFELLLTAKADPYIPNQAGGTVLEVMSQRGNGSFFEILVRHQSSFPPGQETTVLSWLLRDFNNRNHLNERGIPPHILMAECMKQGTIPYSELFRLLLQKGALPAHLEPSLHQVCFSGSFLEHLWAHSYALEDAVVSTSCTTSFPPGLDKLIREYLFTFHGEESRATRRARAQSADDGSDGSPLPTAPPPKRPLRHLVSSAHARALNERDADGRTAFMRLAVTGSLFERAALVHLLTEGLDLTIRDRSGMTALMCAAEAGNSYLIQYVFLLKLEFESYPQEIDPDEYGVVVNTEEGMLFGIFTLFQNQTGCNKWITSKSSPVMALTQFRAQCQQESRVDVNAADHEGRTALMHAVTNGCLAAVFLILLAKGLQIDARDQHGFTALMLAAEKGHFEIVIALLLAGADANAADLNGTTAMMLAIQHGHTDVVSALVFAKGLNPHARDRDGMTACMHAARGGHLEIVKLLLSNTVQQMETLLGFAFKYAQEMGEHRRQFTYQDQGKVVGIHQRHMGPRGLVRDRSLVNMQGPGGVTALMLAARGGHGLMVNYLLSLEEIEIDAIDHLGRTALMYAAENGGKAIFNLLVEKGADPHLQDRYGKTAAQWLETAAEAAENDESWQMALIFAEDEKEDGAEYGDGGLPAEVPSSSAPAPALVPAAAPAPALAPAPAVIPAAAAANMPSVATVQAALFLSVPAGRAPRNPLIFLQEQAQAASEHCVIL